MVIIKREFEKGQTLSLTRLYEIVVNSPGIKLDEQKLKHRIRSNIDYLLRTGKIKRVNQAIYQKL